MINMPPRHGKSELASRRFPAWYLGQQPGKSIIAASYNSDLATDFGRQVRNILDSQEHAALFGAQLADDNRAANRWSTTAGGHYVAAGVGTAITGRGADILLIDDPLKDREEADSELQRGKVWDWYTSTAYTRLAPGGRIIVIQTRWHEDDLSGRLLTEQERGGDKWDVLQLAAINQHGEPLWPEFYPLPVLERYRSVLPARDWSALYQQTPTPDEGDYFKREWFRYYKRALADIGDPTTADVLLALVAGLDVEAIGRTVLGRSNSPQARAAAQERIAMGCRQLAIHYGHVCRPRGDP